MKHTISLDFDELNPAFIKQLKLLFKNTKARLTIIVEDEEDETTYLLKSKANKIRLLQSLQNAREGKVIAPNLDELRELTHA